MKQLEKMSVEDLAKALDAAETIAFYLGGDTVHHLLDRIRDEISKRLGQTLGEGIWSVYDTRKESYIFEGVVNFDVLTDRTPTQRIVPDEFKDDYRLLRVLVMDERDVVVAFHPTQVERIETSHNAIYLKDEVQ